MVLAKKQKAKKKSERVHVMTPVGRLVYPYLHKPDEGRQYSDGKFKTDIIFPKETWKEEGIHLVKAIVQVGREYFGNPKLQLKDFKNPIKDGDEKSLEHYKGHYVITPKSQFKPEIVGPDKQKFTDDRIERIKGGDYARLVVSVFPYEQQGGGVTLGLDVVQFAKEGEALGGGRTAQIEMLDEISADLADLDDEDDMEVEEEKEEVSGIDDDDEEEEEVKF